MAERLIIDNRTDMPMSKALQYVMAVVDQGRISDEGRSYCYTTCFRDGTIVSAFRNKKSDRLMVYRQK